MHLYHFHGMSDPQVSGFLKGVQKLKNGLNNDYVGGAKVEIIDLYAT